MTSYTKYHKRYYKTHKEELNKKTIEYHRDKAKEKKLKQGVNKNGYKGCRLHKS